MVTRFGRISRGFSALDPAVHGRGRRRLNLRRTPYIYELERAKALAKVAARLGNRFAIAEGLRTSLNVVCMFHNNPYSHLEHCWNTCESQNIWAEIKHFWSTPRNRPMRIVYFTDCNDGSFRSGAVGGVLFIVEIMQQTPKRRRRERPGGRKISYSKRTRLAKMRLRRD